MLRSTKSLADPKLHNWSNTASNPRLWTCQVCRFTVSNELMQALLWGPLEAARMTPEELTAAEEHMDYIARLSTVLRDRPQDFNYPPSFVHDMEAAWAQQDRCEVVAETLDRLRV